MFIKLNQDAPKCQKSKIFEHARKSPSDLPTFQCSACGKCCSHIRGMIPKEDKKFLDEFVFGKLPVVQVVPVERMTFPLWDWEAKRFLEWQKEVDVDANIKPLRIIYDLKSDTAINLTYFMDVEKEACHFLKDNKCSIYHTKRAYVCRLFPFNRSPFSGFKNTDELFGECGAMEKILPAIQKEKKEMAKFLYDTFPDGSFINAVQNDIVIEWANKTIVDLIKQGIIKPAVNYPYDFLLKRIKNSKMIDFTEFLHESGYMKRDDVEKMIERFDNNIDAKEKIKLVLETD